MEESHGGWNSVETNFRAKTVVSGSRRLRERTASIIRRKARLRFRITGIACRRDLVFHEYYSMADRLEKPISFSRSSPSIDDSCSFRMEFLCGLSVVVGPWSPKLLRLLTS